MPPRSPSPPPADELNTDGDCALRDAIRAANTDSAVDVTCAPGSGADTITVPAGTYTLTLAGRDEDAALTGDLDFTSDVTINGASAATTIIDSNQLDRVFDILATANIRITRLTLRNGLAVADDKPTVAGGGAIYNLGTLALVSTTVSDNRATGPRPESGGEAFDGGIYNTGTLTITDSAISNNVAKDYGLSDGEDYDDDVFGGGIYNTGTLRLIGAILDNNEASGGFYDQGGEGGGIYNTSGTVTLTNTQVTNNTAENSHEGAGRGGGIVNESGNLILTSSTLEGNSVYGSFYGDSSGGAIDNGGQAIITGSSITDNVAVVSGGISNDGDMQITNSTISGNNAEGGGSGDGPASGGGITNSGVLVIGNSTISGNFVAPGSYGAGAGGGISNDGELTLNNSTITTNISGDTEYNDPGGGGGGLYNLDGSVVMRNTIIAGNIGQDGRTPDCVGTLQSQGYNLLGYRSSCTITGDTTGNLLNVDPNLGPLQDNGGPTPTHALLTHSPALDAGNPAQPGSGGNACEPLDQRGITRPQDGNGDGVARCDIGAFERLAAVPPRLAGVSARCNDEYSEINATITIEAPGEPVTLTALNADLEGATGERGTFRPNLVGQTLLIGTTTIAVTFRGYQFDPNAELRVTVTATFGDQAQS